MDPLSRLLMLNPPEAIVDQNCYLEGAWQLPHAAGALSVIRWHTILEGSAWLDTATGAPLLLTTASLSLLPHNSAHRLRQHTASHTHIICGKMYMPASTQYFLTSLPEVLLLAPEQNRPESLRTMGIVELLQTDFTSAEPGTGALCSLHAAILFTLALRRWLADAPLDAGLFNLLLHPRLSETVTQMMAAPSCPWTVENLAQRVHMSRASFARLFKQVANATPLFLLTSIRMQIAAQHLARQNVPTTAIAGLVGYASEYSFHKAFSRHFGCTPGKYRQRTRELAY